MTKEDNLLYFGAESYKNHPKKEYKKPTITKLKDIPERLSVYSEQGDNLLYFGVDRSKINLPNEKESCQYTLKLAYEDDGEVYLHINGKNLGQDYSFSNIISIVISDQVKLVEGELWEWVEIKIVHKPEHLIVDLINRPREIKNRQNQFVVNYERVPLKTNFSGYQGHTLISVPKGTKIEINQKLRQKLGDSLIDKVHPILVE